MKFATDRRGRTFPPVTRERAGGPAIRMQFGDTRYAAQYESDIDVFVFIQEPFRDHGCYYVYPPWQTFSGSLVQDFTHGIILGKLEPTDYKSKYPISKRKIF